MIRNMIRIVALSFAILPMASTIEASFLKRRIALGFTGLCCLASSVTLIKRSETPESNKFACGAASACAFLTGLGLWAVALLKK